MVTLLACLDIYDVSEKEMVATETNRNRTPFHLAQQYTPNTLTARVYYTGLPEVFVSKVKYLIKRDLD